MKIFVLFITITINSLCFNPAYSQLSSDSLNANSIINRAIDAIGGKEYLQTVKTLYTDIRTTMDGREVHWIVKEMLPNKGSFQITYNNRTVYQEWFNGKKGFEIVNGKKKKVDPDEFKDKLYKRNIFNYLDYIDSSLWKIELVGEEKIEKDSCYKIKTTLANGLIEYLYFSKNTFYKIKSEKVLNKEKNSFSTYFFSGYKKFGKLIYYTEMRFGEDGNYQTGHLENLLVNEMVDESDFE